MGRSIAEALFEKNGLLGGGWVYEKPNAALGLGFRV